MYSALEVINKISQRRQQHNIRQLTLNDAHAAPRSGACVPQIFPCTTWIDATSTAAVTNLGSESIMGPSELLKDLMKPSQSKMCET
jgi:hypothetical protein